MTTCPEICNADLSSDLMSSIQLVDETQVLDRTCNQALLATDDAGLVDVNDPASGAYLTTDIRTKVIASLAEIASHYTSSSETYAAAKQFFANAGTRGVASFFILAFWDDAGGESIASAMDAVNACQPCFTHTAMVHASIAGVSYIDAVVADQLADWCSVNDKMVYLDSLDEATKDPSDNLNLTARLAALSLADQSVFYQTTACQAAVDPLTGDQLLFANGVPVVDYLGEPVDDPANPGNPLISDGTVPMTESFNPYTAFLAAGWVAAVDLSQNNSGYSLAYKPQGGEGFQGIPVSNLTDADVVAITGVFPDGTVNPNNNGYANVYAQTAGYKVLFNGQTVTGKFIDESHLNKFLRRRLRDELATLFVNRRRIPYDDARGDTLLLNAIGRVMNAAQANGHFSNDRQNFEQGGEYLRKGLAWVIRGDRFFDQTAARKNQRIAPLRTVCYVPAGGTHHAPITLCTLATQQ